MKIFPEIGPRKKFLVPQIRRQVSAHGDSLFRDTGSTMSQNRRKDLKGIESAAFTVGPSGSKTFVDQGPLFLLSIALILITFMASA